jgi:hypothetical protein
MVLYVHHYYNDLLFQKLFHNVKEKEIIEIDNEFGAIRDVTFKYKGIDWQVIFNPEINDEEGIHIIDFFGALRQRGQDKNFDGTQERGSECFAIMERIVELIGDKKDWIVSIFRTEKLFIKKDSTKVKLGGTEQIAEAELEILKLGNHQILTDNVFINDSVEKEYTNLHYPFTNIIFQWNEMVGIRWFYDYKNISEVINPKYKIGYSVRRHKPYRIRLAEKLLKIDDVFVSQTNSINEDISLTYYQKIDGAYFNDIDSEIDFQNIRTQQNLTIGFDFFLRILPMYKLQICDESWSDNTADFTSQYLSEKTIGLILAKVPFVCTHSYPYDCLDKLIKVRKHPFYEQSKKYQGNVDFFVDFIKEFLLDFDNNLKLCQDWVDECHNIFMERLHKENSMLDMLIESRIKGREKTTKTLI